MAEPIPKEATLKTTTNTSDHSGDRIIRSSNARKWIISVVVVLVVIIIVVPAGWQSNSSSKYTYAHITSADVIHPPNNQDVLIDTNYDQATFTVCYRTVLYTDQQEESGWFTIRSGRNKKLVYRQAIVSQNKDLVKYSETRWHHELSQPIKCQSVTTQGADGILIPPPAP